MFCIAWGVDNEMIRQRRQNKTKRNKTNKQTNKQTKQTNKHKNECQLPHCGMLQITPPRPFDSKTCSSISLWKLFAPRNPQFPSSFALGNCSLFVTGKVHGQVSLHHDFRAKYSFTSGNSSVEETFSKYSIYTYLAFNYTGFFFSCVKVIP